MKPEINSGIVIIYWLVTPVALLKDGVGCTGGNWWNCDRELNSKACTSPTSSATYLPYAALAYKLLHRRWKQASIYPPELQYR